MGKSSKVLRKEGDTKEKRKREERDDETIKDPRLKRIKPK